MTELTSTPYSDKVSILSDFWANYRFDNNYEGYFFTYYDACHMAYLLNRGLMSDSTENIVRLAIDEAYNALLEGLAIESDTGFKTLDEVMEASPNEEVDSV
jgi:hypothetical protein